MQGKASPLEGIDGQQLLWLLLDSGVLGFLCCPGGFNSF